MKRNIYNSYMLLFVCVFISFSFASSASTFLAVRGGSGYGIAINLMDPNTGQLGKMLWSTMKWGMELPAEQPTWDADTQQLYLPVRKPHGGLLVLDCSNLSQIAIASFTPVNGVIAALTLTSSVDNPDQRTLYAVMLDIYFEAILITLDPANRSYKNITYLTLAGQNAQPPFNFYLGGTSMALDPVQRIIAIPTMTLLPSVYVFLTTINLENTQQQDNYNWTLNPVYGVHWNSGLKKMHGIMADLDEPSNAAEYFWATLDVGKGTYTKGAIWKDLPSPQRCGPLGPMALNPDTNLIYTMWGMGYSCGTGLSILVVDPQTGDIQKQMGPLDPSVFLVIWV